MMWTHTQYVCPSVFFGPLVRFAVRLSGKSAAAINFAALFGLLISNASGQSVTLSLSAGTGSPGAAVPLTLALSGSGVSPSGLQWTMKYSTADFATVTMMAGSAATAAGKQLSCQNSVGSSTCVLWGLNTTAISNGAVATVSVTISPTITRTSSSLQFSGVAATTSNATAIATSATGNTITIVGNGSQSVGVVLPYNRLGIVTDGSTFTGGLDGSGNAYSANLMGSTLNANGASFALGAPNVPNTISSATITAPSGRFSQLAILATGVNGNQASQSFVVTYTDGTAATYKQSLSDWRTPQNYSGESRVVTMAYRDKSSGTRDSRTCYSYGYLFALDPSKTPKSFKLPSSGNVVVLAMALIPLTSPDFLLSATPASQTVVAGSPASYTVSVTALNNFSGPVALSATGLPAGAAATFAPSSVSGSGSSTVHVTTLSTTPPGTYAIAISGTSGSLKHSASVSLIVNSVSQQANLATAFNRLGIAADGTRFTGGLDTGGYAYSANLLGTTISYAGSQFNLGPANTADVVSSSTLALPSGKFSTLAMLGTAVNGNQPSQTFTVRYTDGSSSSFTQDMSDWHTPQSYSGEATVLTMPYRNFQDGSKQIRTFSVYRYSFALNKTKTVMSIALPNNSRVVVLAITLIP